MAQPSWTIAPSAGAATALDASGQPKSSWNMPGDLTTAARLDVIVGDADDLPARASIRRFMAEFRGISGERVNMRVTVTRGSAWPAFEIETEDGKCVVECKRHG
jgi:hypothetical protein